MKLRRDLWVFVAAVAVAAFTWAAEDEAAPVTAADASSGATDEDAIRQSAEAFAKAFNEGDAKSIAAQFVEDGEYVDEFKNIFKGRQAIEDEFAAFFEQSPGNTVTLTVEEVRFVGSNMAIEEGLTTLEPADDSPAVEGRYVAVHLKQDDGSWQIAVSRDLEANVPTPHEHLRQLEWLIGEWVDESEDSIVRTSTRWSDDGNFILSDFHVEADGLRTIDGTQRIGWDPMAKQIRSWVFDSAGGFAEGQWSRVDDEWLIKLSGVSPQGEAGTATNVYTILDDKTLRWSSTHRVLGGELQPDFSAVIVRQPPQLQSDASSENTQPR